MRAGHILDSPELLSQILSHSTKDSVATGLRVCKFWSVVGTPILWRELESERDLQGLLEILVPDDGTMTVGYLAILASQWLICSKIPLDVDASRFFECARLVRHLCVDLHHEHGHIITVLNFLTTTWPVSEIFPALESLEYKARQNDLLYPAIALLHSGVRRWVMDVGPGQYAVHDLIPFSQLHNLTRIDFGQYVTVDNLQNIFVALEVLPILTTILLPPHSVTYDVLRALSRWPALKEIITDSDFDQGYDVCDGEHHPSPPSFGSGAFPELISITISGCPHQLSELLDDPNFPFDVRSLAVETMGCINDPGPIYQKIAAKCSEVNEFVLHYTDSDSYCSFNSLRPFLHYRLTRLTIEPYNPVSFDVNEIEELALSLPLIEYLDIGTSALLLSSPLGKFTFDHLPLFGRHCPKLVRLGILLDVSKHCNPTQSDIVPFAKLQELNLGLTFAVNVIADLDTAVNLLSDLLPNCCQVLCDPGVPQFRRALFNKRLTKEEGQRRERPGWSQDITVT
ncbi:hypothetical protein DXG01_005474 [Tephrocybe rancida]|nr:hypothetical protein DXG01_005474 [Tephrocybe rancida]